ncbi:MAG: hypothetical protein ACFFCZ_15060 [Promethearchaeota archaeon]
MDDIIDIQSSPLCYWIVGSDREFQNLCKEQLEPLGHQVTGFNSVDEAINEILNQAKIPDIFLIDYHLPEQNGLVLSWLLQDLNSISKIIFITTDPCIEDESDPITPIILQQTLDFKRLIRLSRELMHQKQSCLVFFYENERHFIKKLINIIENVVPRRKCLLFVFNPQKIIRLLREAQIDLKHVEIHNVTKYLSGVNYGVKLISLYLNFLKNATDENYIGACAIVDFKALLPSLDHLDLYVNGTTINAVLNYLKGRHYLICAYPLKETSNDCKEEIIKTQDQISERLERLRL